MLGKPDDAKRHYLDAIKVTANMRFRPELAISLYQLAELQLKHFPDEKDEAIKNIDFANKEFIEMKMKPFIEKAEALKHNYGP